MDENERFIKISLPTDFFTSKLKFLLCEIRSLKINREIKNKFIIKRRHLKEIHQRDIKLSWRCVQLRKTWRKCVCNAIYCASRHRLCAECQFDEEVWRTIRQQWHQREREREGEETTRRIITRLQPIWYKSDDAFARYRRGKLILYLLQNRFFCAPAQLFIPQPFIAYKNSRGFL